MAFTAIPGTTAQVQVNSVNYAFDSVQFVAKADTTSWTDASSMYKQFLRGPLEGKVLLSGPWDASNMSAFTIVPGTSLPVILSIYWSVPLSIVTTASALLVEVEANEKVDDIARVQATLIITGQFTAGLP